MKRLLRNILRAIAGWISRTAMEDYDHYVYVANFMEYAREVGPFVFEFSGDDGWWCSTALGFRDQLVIGVDDEIGEPMHVRLFGRKFTVPSQTHYRNNEGLWVIADAYTGETLFAEEAL